MSRPTKTKRHGGNRSVSENVTTLASSNGSEHTPASADALMRLGVMFALHGCDALASLTDAPAPGIVDACDCIAAAAHHLDVSAGFSAAAKRARRREGAA